MNYGYLTIIMRWKGGFLWVLLFMAVSCEDVYDGDKRYVIEGVLLDGIETVANEKVELISNKIDIYKISEEEEERYSQPVGELRYERSYPVFSTVTTDANGHFKFGFPGGDKWVFYIKVRDKFYGYVSYRNMPDYYYNFGELSINGEE